MDPVTGAVPSIGVPGMLVGVLVGVVPLGGFVRGTAGVGTEATNIGAEPTVGNPSTI